MAIEKKNVWEKYPQGPEREKLFAFAEDYRRFISGCKTERECGLTLSDTALSCNHYSLAVYIYQHTVYCDAWCELLAKTIDELRHKA